MVTFFRSPPKANIPLNPFECGDLVHQAIVPGRVVRGFASQSSMGEKTKRTDAICDVHNDHAFVREPVTPIQGH
jgi:hypothetical protein